MWRSRKEKVLPIAVRERRHLVRYLSAGQARFGQQKRHLSAENYRWRLYLIAVFAAIVASGLAGLLRELSAS